MKRPLVLLILLFFASLACVLPGLTPPPPTNTPGPSPTQTTTPTLTPLPSPTPSPTPLPVVRLEAGDKALADGDYFHAHDEYQIALLSSTDDAVRAEALLGLGKTEFLHENYASALEPLRTLTQNYPQSAQTSHAHFLLGETYFDLNRYQESADAYAAYLQAQPGLLDAYVQEKRGDALYALANYPDALAAYQSALQAAGQSNPTGVRVKIANSYANGGNASAALTIYDEITAATGNDYLKAQMALLSGRALLLLDRPADAYTRWQLAVNNYPLAYDSYSALVALLDADQTVDDFSRGLVDYFAGQYGVALAALDRYIANHPDHDGSVLYYRALTLRELGEYEKAVATWTQFINGYSGNMHWAAAWDDRASTEWIYLDKYTEAAQSLEDYANTAVGSPFTITYLINAGRIYERAGELDRAAALWESLPQRFPSDGSFGNAMFLAGIVRYRQAKYPQALDDFKSALSLAADASDKGRALLWIGKTYTAANDPTNAQSAWQQAQTVDASDYYSIRAHDLLESRQPFALAPSYNLNYDLGAERTTAASWLRVKFNLPTDTDLSGPGALAADPRLQRGTEFWELGLYDEARLEFEDIREAVKSDPADSFRLGNYLLDLGAYRSAIFAIRQVLTLAGMDDQSASLNAPSYFNHVRYGLYYANAIWPAAAENNLDPLFVTSLIRQESLFEGFVRSTAGARGLMQIIPTTGASIADKMGWPPAYSDDDLYSPYISIRMGTYYINTNKNLMDGDIYAALAAYNGGPGNAQVWKGLAKGDPDLFLEVIRFGETRDYIRGIYQTYTIYRSLYSPMQ